MSSVKIVMPITLLVISIIAFVLIVLEIRKKNIEIKNIVTWIILNSIFGFFVFYIVIVESMILSNVKVVNIFSWFVVNAFGITLGGQEWVILLLFAFIIFLMIQTVINSVKTQRINKRIDDLNKETAVLSGKVNETAKFKKDKDDSNSVKHSIKIHQKDPIEVKLPEVQNVNLTKEIKVSDKINDNEINKN